MHNFFSHHGLYSSIISTFMLYAYRKIFFAIPKEAVEKHRFFTASFGLWIVFLISKKRLPIPGNRFLIHSLFFCYNTLTRKFSFAQNTVNKHFYRFFCRRTIHFYYRWVFRQIIHRKERRTVIYNQLFLLIK